ncbi:MAG: helix-turn-helix domain-containing protein [Eubacterium sp.]|nr:helix-turn-helix domain-containing protein [Eubacterium sp.]
MTVIGFDKRIKDLRESRKISQQELADRLFVTRSAVNAWEMGNSMPSIDNLIVLARFFHVSTDYLLGLQNEETIDVTQLGTNEKELIQRMLYYMDYLKPEKLYGEAGNKKEHKQK